MVDIKNRDHLIYWLQRRPREDGKIIAVRAALRAIPFLKSSFPLNGKLEQAVLATFRACAVSWSAAFGVMREEAGEVQDAAATVAYEAAREVKGDSAYAVNAAAYAAAYKVNAADTVDGVFAGDADAAANAAAADSSGLLMWKFTDYDCELLEHSGTAALANRDLFQLRQIEGLPGIVEAMPPDDWDVDLNFLQQSFVDWSIWIDWYRDRLHGSPLNRAFEKALLSLTEEEWQQEPAVVNARLKELMTEYSDGEPSEKLGAEIPMGLGFVDTPGRAIDFLAEEIDDEAIKAPEFLAQTDEAIDEIETLLRMCAGRNEPVCETLSLRLEKILAVLSLGASDLNGAYAQTRLAIRCDRLDALIRTETERRELETRDDPAMPEPVFSDVKNLQLDLCTIVEALTKGREFRQKKAAARAEPALAIAAEVFEPLPDILRDASDVVAERVADTFEELIEAASNDNDIEKILAPTANNLFFKVAQRIRRTYKAARDAGGNFTKKVAESAAARMILENWPNIRQWVEGRLYEFFEWVTKNFSGP